MRRHAWALGLVALLAFGPGARADVAKGVDLFERGRFDEAAAVLAPLVEAGDPSAQYLLGVMYLNLIVEPPSESTAFELISKAAEADHVPAQTELARMYRNGDGVDQDFGQMMVWYERAADNGDVGAQLFVADGYAYGYGVVQDMVEAYKWYEIAIQYWGSLAVRARDVVAEKMSDEQVAEAVRRAGAWMAAHPAK